MSKSRRKYKTYRETGHMCRKCEIGGHGADKRRPDRRRQSRVRMHNLRAGLLCDEPQLGVMRRRNQENES